MLPDLIFRGNHPPQVREALPTLLSRRWRLLGFQEVSTPVLIEVELPLDADAANELGAQISAARFSSGAPALEAELPVADELQLGCCCVRVNFRELRKAEVQLPRIDALRSTRTCAHGRRVTCK
jgi:hypothetical protein